MFDVFLEQQIHFQIELNFGLEMAFSGLELNIEGLFEIIKNG